MDIFCFKILHYQIYQEMFMEVVSVSEFRQTLEVHCFLGHVSVK